MGEGTYYFRNGFKFIGAFSDGKSGKVVRGAIYNVDGSEYE